MFFGVGNYFAHGVIARLQLKTQSYIDAGGDELAESGIFEMEIEALFLSSDEFSIGRVNCGNKGEGVHVARAIFTEMERSNVEVSPGEEFGVSGGFGGFCFESGR